MSEQDDRDQIHKIETVPPPEGEDDPYSAPTRVGQMSASTMAELMAAGPDAGAVVVDSDGVVKFAPASKNEGETEGEEPATHAPSDEAEVGQSANRIPIRSEGGTPQAFLPFFGSRVTPMFTRNQLMMIGAAVGAVALGIYLLFN